MIHRVKPQHRSECGYRLMYATILWTGGPTRGETLVGGRNQPKLRSLLGNWVNGGVSQGLPVPGEESAVSRWCVAFVFFSILRLNLWGIRENNDQADRQKEKNILHAGTNQAVNQTVSTSYSAHPLPLQSGMPFCAFLYLRKTRVGDCLVGQGCLLFLQRTRV